VIAFWTGSRAARSSLLRLKLRWAGWAAASPFFFFWASAGAVATIEAVPRTRATPSAILETDFIENASC
jgi:hypothetical protein